MLPRKQPRSLRFTSWFASIVVGDHTHRRCLGRLESHDLALPREVLPEVPHNDYRCPPRDTHVQGGQR